MISRVRLVVMSLGLLVLAGCLPGEQETPTPVPTNTPEATSTPTATSVPTNTPVIVPTATPMSTDTPLPPQPTATPTEPPFLAPGYQLLGQNAYTSFGGTAIVVGVLKYTGDEVTTQPPINITLEDAEHNMLATDNAFTVPNIIKPGTLVPFREFFVTPPANWKHAKIQVFPQATDRVTLVSHTADFEFSRTNMRPNKFHGGGGVSVVGEVKNTGNVRVIQVEVIVAVWDSEGRLLDVDSALSSRPTMDPGDTGPFEVFIENGVGAARYDLVATAPTMKIQK